MSDEALAALAKSGRDGSSEAVNELLERYKDTVRTTSRAYFLMGADSEDVIQEGMIGLYRAVMNYDETRGKSFSAFAYMCIVRQIQTAVKNSQRLKQWPLNFYESLNKTVFDEDSNEVALMDILPDEFSPDPEKIVIEQDTAQTTADRIAKLLSPFENRVLELYLGGMDYRSIAQSVDKTPKAVDNALQRIRKKLTVLFA